MKCAILQPSYIPWRGYFHQIEKADVFVFYDCVQYDDRGWRNRNKIKTPGGNQWLTVPVRSKGCQTDKTPIFEIPVAWETEWPKKHLKALCVNYAKAPYFRKHLPLLEEIYSRRDQKLADFTCHTTQMIAKTLGINETRFIRSSGLEAQGCKTDRLIGILGKLGATHYISGPSAANYIEREKFDEAGISLEFMVYDYPEYPQTHDPFLPNVSVLDLLFNVGPGAHKFIWG